MVVLMGQRFMLVGMGVGCLASFFPIMVVQVMIVIVAVPMVVEGGDVGMVMRMFLVDQKNGSDNGKRQGQQEEESWRLVKQQQRNNDTSQWCCTKQGAGAGRA